MRKIIIYLAITVLTYSCAIYGLTNDYNKLDKKEKLRITKLSSFDNIEKGKIYELNAEILKTELIKYPKSIVYVFTNACTSSSCKPLSVYKDYADKNGYKIFFVMKGYGRVDETLEQNESLSLFSIDSDYYQTKYSYKYTRYFENELMGIDKNTKHKEYLGSIFFFENGTFTKVYQELPK
ncbi:MAG TPA: hypothetical protein PLS84_02880 [Salinivirgaceae bacterium]|nr:hypothetical protein [Salinivirgaceae bacterium]